MGTTAQWERILNNSYCLLLAVRKLSTVLIGCFGTDVMDEEKCAEEPNYQFRIIRTKYR